ncbi:MAG: hypothetical protein ABJB74_14020 [Gemmatimonas sp.]
MNYYSSNGNTELETVASRSPLTSLKIEEHTPTFMGLGYGLSDMTHITFHFDPGCNINYFP